jgi:hypothetical protein
MMFLYHEEKTERLSERFESNEFVCSCCGYALIDSRLIHTLDSISNFLGKKVRIQRGYSCPRQNARYGGELLSRHIMGLAANITWDGFQEDIAEGSLFRKWITDDKHDLFIFGVGFAQDHMHVDIDALRKHLTVWSY